MTDEEIEKALKVCSETHNVTCGIDCPHKTQDSCRQNLIGCAFNYIDRLKESNENMHGELMSYKAYIDNHEEIWKQNAEIEKAQIRKDTAKEILVKWWKENIATGNEYGNDYVDELVLDYGLDYDDFRTSIEVDDE